MKPAEVRFGCGPTKLILSETRDRAVVDDLSLLVAPAAVDSLSHGPPLDIARDHTIDKSSHVRAADAVFEQRRDVNHGGSVADGVVFGLGVCFVDAGSVGVGPVAEVETLAQLHYSFVECGSYRHGRPFQTPG